MIQNRRRSRHQNGSAKSNKTFDKHNGIKRIKDEEIDLDPRNFDLNALIKEENLDRLNQDEIDFISDKTGIYL